MEGWRNRRMCEGVDKDRNRVKAREGREGGEKHKILCSVWDCGKKEIISCNKKKSYEWLCSAQVMEVMPGWGLCSFHHKAPSGILARPRLSRPLAL